MRMTLDLLHELTNMEVFCLFHNCMWQSRHPDVDVYFPKLCEQSGWLSTHKSSCACLICVLVFVYTFNRQVTQLFSQVSAFLSLCFRSQTRHLFRFPWSANQVVTHSKISPCLIIGCLILVGFVGSFHYLQQLLNSNKLGNFNPFRWASCTSTQYTVSWCTFHFYKTWFGQIRLFWILVILMRFTAVKNTVCLSLLEFLSSRYQSWIDDGKWIDCTSNMINVLEEPGPENWHCPVKQDQWDCVLNDLEELGGDEFLLKNQCSTGIVNISQDCLWFSRIQSPHHLFEVDDHDENDWAISSTLKSRWANNLVVQYRSKFCSKRYSLWADRSTSLWFCFGL